MLFGLDPSKGASSTVGAGGFPDMVGVAVCWIKLWCAGIQALTGPLVDKRCADGLAEELMGMKVRNKKKRKRLDKQQQPMQGRKARRAS
jgi:hypothetical protein